jgi:hypothetical protein
MRNLSLKSIAPDLVVDGVNVYYGGTIVQALFGPHGQEYWKIPVETIAAGVSAWMKRNGAHYYGEDKWHYDEDGNISGIGFTLSKGIAQAKRFGARVLVAENLS